MPALGRLAQTVLAGDRGIQAMVGIDQFHGGVGAVDDDTAAVNDGAPGVGALQPLGADAVLGHQHIGGGVGGLHGGQDPHINGPLDVFQGQDLEVLDAQAGILSGILLHHPLIGVQQLVVGAVADGVAARLIAVIIGQLHQLVHLLVGGSVIAQMTGPVAVLLQHGGGAGPQGAVAEQLDRPDVHVFIIQTVLRLIVAQIIGLSPLGGGQGHQNISAQLQTAVLIQGLVHLVQGLHGGAGVHGRSEPVGEQLILGQQQGLLLLLDGERGEQGADRTHGGIGHTAQQFSVLRLQILAALGIWGILRDARQLKSHGVHPAHMAVRPGEVHRVVGGHRVQLLLGGIVAVLPHGVHPAPAADPLAGLGRVGRLLHRGQNILLGFPEGIDLKQAFAKTVDMHMALDQAGDHGVAAQIHHLGAGADVGLHTGLIAHIDQPVALDGNGAGHGELLIHRINIAVAVYTVGSFGCRRRGGEEGEKHGKCQNRAKNASKAFA